MDYAVGTGGLKGGGALLGAGRKKNMRKKYCHAVATSPWIAHVRQIANSNGVNYAQALSDPSTRISYYTMQGKPVPPLKVRSNWGCATPLGTQAKRKLSVARTKVERKQTPSEERKRALRAKYGVKERGE